MTTEPNNNEITSLGEFILRVESWHESHVQGLNHFLNIPDNGGVEIEFEGKSLKLEGDVLLAFRAGIAASLDALGQLPFTSVEEEQPAPEILGVENNDGA